MLGDGCKSLHAMSSRRDVLGTDARALLVWVEAFNVLIKSSIKFCLNHLSRMAMNKVVCAVCRGHDGSFADMMLMLKEFFTLYPSGWVSHDWIPQMWMCISRRKEDYSSWPWWYWRWSSNVHNARSFQLPGMHASHIFDVVSFQSWRNANVTLEEVDWWFSLESTTSNFGWIGYLYVRTWESGAGEFTISDLLF